MAELYKALQSMEPRKAPGIDVIPVDFYKSLWEVVGEDVLSVLNESLAGGILPVSCQRPVLTLLPNKGDLTDITNWYPVSLLCSYYKLLSKVLANRMHEVLVQVIHPDQTYCVPGRTIFDNILLVRDAIDTTKMFNIDLGLISLDLEKAFDQVEHDYLWKVLEVLGFCKDFIDLVMVLYNDAESVQKINDELCSHFKLFRGVRQGWSLSGMLYSIAI